MKNGVRILVLALALALTWIGTLSADGTLSCGIPCSSFDTARCFYTYDPVYDVCVPHGGWQCLYYACGPDDGKW